MAKAASKPDDPLKVMRQKVNILRHQVPELGEDDNWRDFLYIWAKGETSTRAMVKGQLDAVIKALHRAGAPKAKPKSRYTETPLHAKARAIWIALADAGVVRDRSDAALDGYLRRMADRQDVGLLSTAQWCGAVEGLKAWATREGVELQP